MKKNILFIFATIFAALMVFSSCSKDTEGLTRITYYPTLEVQGDEFTIIDKGSTYTDKGCKATLNGEDVSDKLEITNNVDTSKSGAYTITYKATNSDGFSKTATRTVVVVDKNDPFEGAYLVDDQQSYRLSGSTVSSYGGYYVLVLNNGDGTYDIDDLLGGFYSQFRGYGSNYCLDGTVNIADDGTITLVYSYLDSWGDSADELIGSHDAANQSISMVTTYAGMQFNVIMTNQSKKN